MSNNEFRVHRKDPQELRKNVMVTLDPTVHARAQELAKTQNVSFSRLIELLLRRELEEPPEDRVAIPNKRKRSRMPKIPPL